MDQNKIQQRFVVSFRLLTIFAIPLFLSGCIISPQEKTVLDAGKLIISESLKSEGGLPYIRGWKKLGTDVLNPVGGDPNDENIIVEKDIEIVISTGRSKEGRIPQWRLRVFQFTDDEQGAILLKECGLPEAQSPSTELDESFECKDLPNNSQLQVLLQYQIKGWPKEIHSQDTVLLRVEY